jgi:hypothetical protein
MATLTLTITVPDDKAADLRDAICEQYKYQDMVGGEPNPQTRTQFAQEKWETWNKIMLKNVYQNYKLAVHKTDPENNITL